MSLKVIQMFSRICARCNHVSMIKTRNIASSTNTVKRETNQKITVPHRTLSSEPVNLSDYPSNVEVSYDEFKYVEAVLPKSTVPDLPHHPSYPTPSGWIPPNDELRSKQPYLVRRTKNHVLPVYAVQKETWGRIMHHIDVKRVDGDIWKLEADLRHFLSEKYGLDSLYTQVHEVSRCVRIRGQYHEDIAQFLLDHGM